MPEYGFCVTHIFTFQDRICDATIMRKNVGQKKPVFWYVLRSGK